jgi:hypothetical protein
LTVETSFEPLFMLNLGGASVPGLTRPFTTVIDSRAAWENFGCNPATKQFYINE